MFSRIRAAARAVKDPIVATRELDLAAGATWFCYALWGLLSAMSDLTVFQAYQQWEQAYPMIWGGMIGLFSLGAAVSAVSTLFLHPHRVAARIRFKRAERFLLWGAYGLIAVYPITLLFQGDSNGNVRWDILALSLSFFPFGVFRVRHLSQRIRQLYAFAAAETHGGT